jgi:hypothetical protein
VAKIAASSLRNTMLPAACSNVAVMARVVVIADRVAEVVKADHSRGPETVGRITGDLLAGPLVGHLALDLQPIPNNGRWSSASTTTSPCELPRAGG